MQEIAAINLLIQLRLEAEREALVREIQALVNQQLMLAMRPLAEALQRQDNLEMERLHSMTLEERVHHRLMVDLLTEVLTSLQPTAEQQLIPALDPSIPHRSSPSSTS